MSNLYIDENIIAKDFSAQMVPEIFLYENNEEQINKIYDFLRDDKKLMLVSGYTGSGKTKVVNYSVKAIKSDVIFLHYSCLETTTIEDMFLSFFETFRQLVLSEKISPPKDKADNFTQKINAYFNSIEAPILIELDSFDSIIKENKASIVDFVNHISKLSNVKTIIVSRNFEEGMFDGSLIENITILPLNRKVYEKYLKQVGLKLSGVFINEFYKLSKGYFRTIVLTLNIMNLRQLTMMNFLEMFSESYMTFSEYVIKEAIALVDPMSIHLFRLLTIMRIPIHIKLLNLIKMYDAERIKFFVDNSILSQEGEYIYLKECFRNYIEPKIPDNVRVKLHKACIDLYNTQLPLKPSERDLVLSRQTMRNEIEYHSLFLPFRPEMPSVPTLTTESKKQIEKEIDIPQNVEPTTKPQETKEEKINKIEFIIPDVEVLENIADSIKDFVESGEENSKLEQVSSGLPLRVLVDSAIQQEREYNYKHAIMLYQQALTKTHDDDFYTFLPTIYVRLAQDYKNLSQWYEALEYYTQAQDFYENVSNRLKAAEIKLEIANIYYIIYKNDNAKFILSELEKHEDLPNDLRIKINLALAKITESSEVEHLYYKKSIPLATAGIEKALLSELYYKYAVSCDEADDIKTAATYYKKCVDVDNNLKNNPYLSKALSNMAELYDESGSVSLAVKYLQESIDVDLSAKNYNDLHYSYIRLGEIYSNLDEQKATENFNKAVEFTKYSNDPFGKANTNLKVGDFYYNLKNYDMAYMYYNEALDIAKVSLAAENINTINQRFDAIKRQIPEVAYNVVRGKYDK